MMKAEQLARKFHADQTDKSGAPYVCHLERVVNLLPVWRHEIAWLHDILEDTPLSVISLRIAGIQEHVIESVVLLTRKPGEVYADYIQRIKDSGNFAAKEVKLADLKDHVNYNADGIPQSLKRRYYRAIFTLTSD